jgi:hypothetical protein
VSAVALCAIEDHREVIRTIPRVPGQKGADIHDRSPDLTTAPGSSPSFYAMPEAIEGCGAVAPAVLPTVQDPLAVQAMLAHRARSGAPCRPAPPAPAAVT